MFLSFIIPCYRSENTIEFVIQDIVSLMKDHKEDNYEIITINDGSPDNVLKKLIELTNQYDVLKVIDLANNFGQVNATYAGMKQAQGDIVIMLVDDGQTPVQETYRLVEQLDNGYDVAIAEYNDKKNGFLRKIGSAINESMMRWVINKPKNLVLSDFWAMRKFISDELCACTAPSVYMSGYLLRITNNIVNVSMDGQNRISGQSGYSIGKLISLWLTGFTAFSIKPLRAMTGLGFLVSLTGFILSCVTIIRKLLNPNILAGYASIMSVMLLLGGCILLMLGLIGEYIGRAYMCVNDNPQYVIRAQYGNATLDNKADKIKK